MKRIVLLFALIFGLSATANAQLYLGGGLGFGSDGEDRLTVRIAPDIGYCVTNHFTVGGRLSYQSGINQFGVDPYVRLNIFNPESIVRLMATAHAPFRFASDYFGYGFYLQPGISFRVGESTRLECHIGAFGWGKVRSGGVVQSGWEAAVNGNTVSVGVVFGL